MSEPSRVVESQLRVRYAETDSMGIVYHANYLIWMEVGRTDYFRALGFSYRQLEQDYQLYTPLVEVQCRYLAAACYDDEIVVRTSVKQLTRKLIRFNYQVYRADRVKLAEGESVHLVVDRNRKRTNFPTALLELFVDSNNTTADSGQAT